MFILFRLGATVGLLMTIAWAQETATEKAPAQQEDLCATVQGQRQMNICTAEQYQKSDAHLSALYSEIQGALQRSAQTPDLEQKIRGESALAKLQSAEQAWIQYRDLHCRAAKDRYEGGTISPSIWSECMKLVTDHRIEDLKFACPVDGHLRK